MDLKKQKHFLNDFNHFKINSNHIIHSVDIDIIIHTLYTLSSPLTLYVYN